MAAIQIGHAQHCQHVEVSGFKFIGSQKILDRLIESLDLIFEFRGGYLRFKVIRIFARLLHGGLNRGQHLLAAVSGLIAGDRWMVGWKILTLLAWRSTETGRG